MMALVYYCIVLLSILMYIVIDFVLFSDFIERERQRDRERQREIQNVEVYSCSNNFTWYTTLPT